MAAVLDPFASPSNEIFSMALFAVDFCRSSGCRSRLCMPCAAFPMMLENDFSCNLKRKRCEALPSALEKLP